MAETMLDRQYDHLDNGMYQPPIRVGCVNVHPTEGVLIKRVQADGYYATDSRYYPFEHAGEGLLARRVDSLLGESPMWSEWLAAYRAEYGIERVLSAETENQGDEHARG